MLFRQSQTEQVDSEEFSLHLHPPGRGPHHLQKQVLWEDQVSLAPSFLALTSHIIYISPPRGPVRFHDPGYSSSEHSVLYPLDEDLTNKLSSIQLSCEPFSSSQERNGPNNADAQMSSGLSRLEISSSKSQ